MNNLPVYIINLDERKDRLAHTLDQFNDKAEFHCNIVSTKRKKNGRLDLWNNLVNVVKIAKTLEMPFVIFCEDDHLFTGNYSYKKLSKAIQDADLLMADLLLGGVSWFDNALQVAQQIFWVSEFTGLQFTVIYARFYETILNAKFDKLDAADIKLSHLSHKKFTIHPFISIQKEFGYSDITIKNNIAGHVKQLFKSSSITLDRLKKVKKFYSTIEKNAVSIDDDFSEIYIPTYIINFQDKAKLSTNIESKISDEPELQIKMVSCDLDNKKTIWKSLQNMANNAIDNDDDVFIVFLNEDNYPLYYCKHTLFKSIIASHVFGAELLLANAANLEQIVPITNEYYWFNQVEKATLFVVYRGLFEKILSYNLQENEEIFGALSSLSSHKILLYPFISGNSALETPVTAIGDEAKVKRIKMAMSELNIC